MTSQIDRQFLLLRTLADAKSQWDVESLAINFETSAKTIRRDLANLRRAGFKINESNGPNGKKTYQVDVTDHLPLHLTFDEALALFLGCHVGSTFNDSELGQAATSALQKLRITLGSLERDYLEKAIPSFYRPKVGSDYSNLGDVIDGLRLAIEDCLAIFIEYRSARSTEAVSYDIHPYALVEHRGSLYLIGYSCYHDSIRTWKIDRITSVELTKMPFRRPTDFNAATYLSGAFAVVTGDAPINVRIRFMPCAARYVSEKKMHCSQTVEMQSDGTAIATFDLTSTFEIKSWILSFGGTAEVLGPPGLRESMRIEVNSMVQRYEEIEKDDHDGQIATNQVTINSHRKKNLPRK